MSILSKICLTIFEIVNEVYVAVGAGVVGIGVLVNHGYKTNQMLRTLSVATITLGSLFFVFRTSAEMRIPTKQQLVVISGCDSGLGFSMAIHAHELGFSVLAGFLNLESPGALEIREKYKKIHQIRLDITDNESIHVAIETVVEFLKRNSYKLYALVNNAGVMIFGEFEWQTERLIKQQLDVNLYGTMMLSKAFIPLLRQHKGRMINITSHCSTTCLPGLSTYGATKAAVKAYTDGLRIELAKYGVKVIAFIPGSFVMESNIMAKHTDHVHEMFNNFTKEQYLFYEDYFQRFHAHLLGIPIQKVPSKVVNNILYQKFEQALLLESPKASYKVEPFRYAFYHFLFKITPTPIRDYLVVKFMQMPEYDVAQAW